MIGRLERTLQRGIARLAAGWHRYRPGASRDGRGEPIAEDLSGLDARLLADLGVTRSGKALPGGDGPPRQRRQMRTRPPIISAQPRMRQGSAVCWANPTQPK